MKYLVLALALVLTLGSVAYVEFGKPYLAAKNAVATISEFKGECLKSNKQLRYENKNWVCN